MLIQLMSTGKVQKHSTIGGTSIKRFALEEGLISYNDTTYSSSGIANVDTAYASGALVEAVYGSTEAEPIAHQDAREIRLEDRAAMRRNRLGSNPCGFERRSKCFGHE